MAKNNPPTIVSTTTIKLDQQSLDDLGLVAWIDTGGNNSEAIRRLVQARAAELRIEHPALVSVYTERQVNPR